MKKSRKMLRNLALFIVLIFITFYVVFKNEDLSQVWKIIMASDKRYFLADDRNGRNTEFIKWGQFFCSRLFCMICIVQ